jgi:hypothetical protein
MAREDDPWPPCIITQGQAGGIIVSVFLFAVLASYRCWTSPPLFAAIVTSSCITTVELSL